ncbi:thiol reductant ABC exporter subunit CydC [Halalkalibacter kiskunsagensis]|uniref:Thiol reductant ABC exporter subunit CydC n=1 Tax=Halalkalibacter kiskunsagensis TaxID=1548599 RepID=A0ABV6KBJ2_9BACI
MKELFDITGFIMRKKKDVILSIMFGYIAGMTAVGLFAANGYLISRAALETPLYVLITMVAVVKIGSFLRAGSRYAERYYSHRATFTMLSDLRVYFYERLESKAPNSLQKHRSGDLLARIVGDVEALQNFFLRVVYPPIIMVTVFVSTIFFVGFYSIQVVILLAIGLCLTGFIIPAWFAKKQKESGSSIREKRSHMSTEVTEWLQGFRELKIHQKLKEKDLQLNDASNAYIKEQEREGTREVANQSVNMASALLISWAVLATGGYLVASNQLDGVFLAMLVMMSLTLFEHSTPMAVFPIYYEDSERAAKRLYSVVDKKEQGGSVPKDMSQEWEGAPSIELKNVSYTFPREWRKALHDVSLFLPAGSKTAIVGPSGSGKSTLLQLILNLHSSTKGEIYLDGIPVKELEQDALWKKTNVVLQDNHFFYGTIQDNLLLPNDSWSEDELQQILADVQLPSFSLSDQVMEKGENLSGGQRQRLAMARAIAKGSSLWLLDEPTSSLDSWTERRLYDLLVERSGEDTVVVISHRLAELEQIDQIIVMDQGKIVESGTFTELMEGKGYFYQMKQIENNVLQHA